MTIVDEFRPRHLNEIVGQDVIIRKLQAMVRTKDIVDQIFNGPFGSGKTTAARAFANDLYSGELEGNYLELNASDERGIDTVRTKIKSFAKEQSKLSLTGLPRLIVLDEADQLTNDAQKALRGIIGNYEETSKFILDGNECEKLYPALESRCLWQQFNPIPDDVVLKRVNMICEKKGIGLDKEMIQKLIKFYKGDLRRIQTNALESALLLGPPYKFEDLCFSDDVTAIAASAYALTLVSFEQVRKFVHQTMREKYVPRKLFVDALYDVLPIEQKAKTAQYFSIVADRIRSGSEVIHLDYILKVVCDANGK